jgi:hypothetical protein
LVSASGKPMKREADLIDVGLIQVLPYAQWHYPFENKDKIDENKDFQLISLLKVWIKHVVVLYCTLLEL